MSARAASSRDREDRRLVDQRLVVVVHVPSRPARVRRRRANCIPGVHMVRQARSKGSRHASGAIERVALRRAREPALPVAGRRDRESATFWLFALVCVVCLVWIVRKVPETKGRTLEEIEAMWTHGDGATPGRGRPEGRRTHGTRRHPARPERRRRHAPHVRQDAHRATVDAVAGSPRRRDRLHRHEQPTGPGRRHADRAARRSTRRSARSTAGCSSTRRSR